MLFAQAFALAPLFSIFVNLIEQKSTIERLSNYSQRFEALPAKNIGSWLAIGEVSLCPLMFLDSFTNLSWS
jgi:Calcium-activated chloride channel